MTVKRICLFVLILSLSLFISGCTSTEGTYKSAQNLLAQGKYTKAAAKFESIGSYNDASTLSIYCKACALCESGDFDTGIAELEKLGDYKDCEMRIIYYTARSWDDASVDTTEYEWMERAKNIYSENPLYLDSTARINALDKRIAAAKETLYNEAVNHLENDEYWKAYSILSNMRDYKDAGTLVSTDENLRREEKFSIGKYISFGSYPQTKSETDDTPIEWQILARDEKKALLISRYALDARPYHTSLANVTWQTSSLRTWLNSTFLNKAFSTSEQAAILTTTVAADKNSKYSTNPGNATNDKVFLLSITEVEKYFTTDESRKCALTAYAKKQGAYRSFSYETASGEATCCWWLRSPGFYQDFAADVYDDGSVLYFGSNVNDGLDAVRPALWINLDSGIF